MNFQEEIRKINRKIERLDRCKANCGDVNSYKVYTALLNQSGTDAPIATVLQNTLNVNVEYIYNDVGDYIAVFDKPLFNSPNEYVLITGNSLDTVIEAFTVFYDALQIHSYDGGALTDNVIGNLFAPRNPCILEIRQYI